MVFKLWYAIYPPSESVKTVNSTSQKVQVHMPGVMPINLDVNRHPDSSDVGGLGDIVLEETLV